MFENIIRAGGNSKEVWFQGYCMASVFNSISFVCKKKKIGTFCSKCTIKNYPKIWEKKIMHSGKVYATFSLERNLFRVQSSASRRHIHVVKKEDYLDVEIPKHWAMSVVKIPTFRRIKTANNWSMKGRCFW